MLSGTGPDDDCGAGYAKNWFECQVLPRTFCFVAQRPAATNRLGAGQWRGESGAIDGQFGRPAFFRIGSENDSRAERAERAARSPCVRVPACSSPPLGGAARSARSPPHGGENGIRVPAPRRAN